MKTISLSLVSVALLAAASPAAAQWTRVTEVPATNIFSVWASGDTILASADSVVYVSIDGGSSWKGSKKVAAGVAAVTSAITRNGRLYAGTFGQGVFVSDNLGGSWTGFNQGIAGLAVFIQEMLFLNDKVYAATGGDGVWARSLVPPGNWGRFGDELEPNQASNVSAIALGGTRLLAAGGANGMVFLRDPGDSDWTDSFLDNNGLHPSWAALSAIWTGSRWLVGANIGLFQSANGQSPWLIGNPGLGPLSNVSFALRAPDVLVAFTTALATTISFSHDGGDTFQALDTQPAVFVFRMATHDNTLYAARTDGLWRRSIATVPTKPVTWGSVKALYRTPHN
jgi:hypothetical protein